MADEREGEPKIRIVDRRMLSDEEREGRGEVAAGRDNEPPSAPPKLEIVGGYSSGEVAETEQATEAGGEPEEEERPLTAEEEEQIRQEFEQAEQEQVAAIEKQMGRPLTEQEKEQVRAEMERQAQSMTALEIAPMLQQMMAELSGRAAVHLGLMPNPYTRLVARNDIQARMAIDAFAAMLDIIRPEMDARNLREYERVLNDLRVNYVSITGNKTSGPSRIIH